VNKQPPAPLFPFHLPPRLPRPPPAAAAFNPILTSALSLTRSISFLALSPFATLNEVQIPQPGQSVQHGGLTGRNLARGS
jgi:hypothetical protein